MAQSEEEWYLENFGGVKYGPAITEPTEEEWYKNNFADTPYVNINNGKMATLNNKIPGIETEMDAVKFAATMGLADTYRGVKQILGVDEQQMREDQRKLNMILANKDFGTAAFAAYAGSLVADPAGWFLPIAKAKSISQLVKLGVTYGGGFGAAGYVDEDGGYSRLQQAGVGAIGGGILGGTMGVVGRQFFGFDPKAIARQDELKQIPAKDLQQEINRSKQIRRQTSELSRLKSIDEKMTLTESIRKNYGIPTWNKIVANPLGPLAGVAAGGATYTGLSAINTEGTAGQAAFNTLGMALSYMAGKKYVGDKLNWNQNFNKFMYGLAPEARMNPDVLAKLNAADGRVATHTRLIAEISEEVAKLSPDEKKLAYHLFSGDISKEQITDLMKGGKVTRTQLKKFNELTPREQYRSKEYGEKFYKEVDVEEFLGITKPKSAETIFKLSDEHAEVMKNIGDDLRLAGVLDEDVFLTNMNRYMHRNYDKIKKLEGEDAANLFKSKLQKIRGDSLKHRGAVYISHTNKSTFTADELQEVVPKLREERKNDHRINEVYTRKYTGKEDVINATGKTGKYINRIEEEADPGFIKGKSLLDQDANYGVVVKKAAGEKDKYKIITQLTKNERKSIGELEDLAWSLARSAEELKTTVGLSNFYKNTYDIGLSQGFVLTKQSYLSARLGENNLTRGADGKFDTSDTINIRLQIKATLESPFISKRNKRLELIKLRKEHSIKEKAVNKLAKKIEREAENLKKATLENPAIIKNRITGEKEKFVYVPDVDDPNGLMPIIQKGEKATRKELENSIPAYGKLKGTLMRVDEFKDAELLRKLKDPDWTNKGWGKKYFGLQKLWKKTKTVYNPAVHTNNTIANFTMFHMAGGKWGDLSAGWKEWNTILDFEAGKIKFNDLPQDLKDMFDHNVFGSDFLTADLRSRVDVNEIKKTLNLKAVEKNGNWLESAVDTLTNQFTSNKLFKKIDEKVSNWYQVEDRVFRIALYKSRLKQVNPATGLKYTKEEAAADSIKWFVDYNIRSKYINNLRNSVIPFLSYSYRAFPLIAQTAIERPLKLGSVAALMYAANDWQRALSGDTRSTEERQRKFMQQYQKKKAFGITGEGVLGLKHPFPSMPEANIRLNIPTPFGTIGGPDKYFDISRKLPGGDVFAMGGETPGALPFLPTAMQFGGPGIGAFQRLYGTEPFTGRQKTAEEAGMTAGEIAASRAGSILKDFIPNLPIPGLPEPISTFSGKKIERAYHREYGGGKYQTLSDPLTTFEAVANSLGLTVNTADLPRLSVLRTKELSSIEKRFSQKRKNIETKRMKGEIDLDEFRGQLEEIKQDFRREYEEWRDRE